MITERLTLIQKELRVPKNQFNAFGKYKYRSCEDILEAVKPLLADAVLTLSDDLVMIGDRYYIRATAALRDNEESIITTAYAREEADKKGMDSAQITGSVSSYARKYALNGLFLIDDTKDADTMDNTKSSAKTEKPLKDTEPEPPGTKVLDTKSPLHKKIEALIKEAGFDREMFKEWLAGITWIKEKDGRLSLSTLSEKNAKSLCEKWESACKTFNAYVDAGNQPGM